MSFTRSRDTEQSVQNSVQSSPSAASRRPNLRAARRTETNRRYISFRCYYSSSVMKLLPAFLALGCGLLYTRLGSLTAVFIQLLIWANSTVIGIYVIFHVVVFFLHYWHWWCFIIIVFYCEFYHSTWFQILFWGFFTVNYQSGCVC